MNTFLPSFCCPKCDKRVPKNRPLLICSVCDQLKHYSCNKLSKNEAISILENGFLKYWTCQECITDIFPNSFDCNTDKMSTKTSKTANEPIISCTVCNKVCSPHTTSICPWCHMPCHAKCSRNTLGCLNCCNNMIPGYNYNVYEITGRAVNNSFVFNPYDSNLLNNQIGTASSADDDSSMFNEISEQLKKCKYSEPKNVKMSQSHELKIMSLNIRSLTKNIVNLRENSDHFNKFDVLCFCETNCNTNLLPQGTDSLLIEGFHAPFIQNPARTSNKGGGLAIYVNRRVCDDADLEVVEIENLTSTNSCEFMFLKINVILNNNKNNKKSFIIGNFYRSPSASPNEFCENFECILSKLDRHKNKNIILVGDYNVDLVKLEYDNLCQHLIDLTTRHGFLQTISRPTRVTDHSATLIDHIYTNQIHNMLSSGIITYDLTDHLGTYISITIQDNTNFGCNETEDIDSSHYFQKFNAQNCENFTNLIAQETWDDVISETDTQLKYNKFIEQYTKIYEQAFPKILKPKLRKRRKNSKPWLLPWLEDACDRKNRLYSTFIKNPTVENKIKYEKIKKFTTKHLKLAKDKFYNSYFQKYSSDSRKQWQMLNSLLNRQKNKRTPISLKDQNGCTISDPSRVAEKFNDYFVNIANKLKTQINAGSNLNAQYYKTHLKNPVAESLYLSPSHQDEVYKTINLLKPKSTSDTNIDALKAASAIPNFNYVLTDIINSSFEQGIFPSQLKLAKVVPIHKSGPKNDVTNYRPISLLSAFSKIFEKLIHSRVYNFLQQNNSLHDLQFGFRAGRSCEQALLVAQNEILESLSRKQISMLLLIDFSKAFDMVNHDILLDKLKHYGIRGIANEWFRSYLTDREQYVSICNKYSSKKFLNYSVPQGSILGPLLFLVYINDLPNISKLAKFILYADDANIIITGNSIPEIMTKFNEVSCALVDWVSHNELLLNAKKTNYMLFSRSRNINMGMFVPKLANVPIERKNVARFLGVLVDDKLSWKYHIAAIKSKMSRYIGILYKLKSSLPLKARLLTFNSLIQSHLYYCSLVWGSSNKSNIESLFVTQKKAMRAIMPGPINYYYNAKDDIYPTHTKAAFKTFNILTVHNIILTNIMIFMNKLQNFPHILPDPVSQTIPPNSPSLTNPTDYCSEWYTKYNCTPFNTTTFFKGPLLYADIMSDNQNLQSAFSFEAYKKSIKSYLLEVQCSGNHQEWEPENFKLFNLTGLRQSVRLLSKIKHIEPS